MKTSVIGTALVLLLAMIPAGLRSDSYLGGEPRLPESREHPYLLFDRSEVPGLLAKKDNSGLFRDWYETISRYAQNGSGSSVSLAAAFMYQMTDSTKYSDKTKDYLFSMSPEFIDNAADNDLTRHARIISFVYDWVQPALTQGEDEEARENLIRLAEYHYDWVLNNDRNEFIREGNNWSNNHNFGHQAALALLAITLPEHEMAMTWLRLAMNYQYEQFSYYVRNAPYFEGSSYTDVFIDLAIPQFYAAYRHACGINVFDDSRIPLEEMFYSTMVEQIMPDGHSDPTRGAPLNLIHITKMDHKRPFWRFLISLLRKPNDLNWSLGDPGEDSQIGDKWRLIFPYITYNEIVPFNGGPAINPTLLMEGNHEIVFRKDWAPGSSFLHFYGRKVATGYHGHCDQLTFNIFAHGARLVTDYEHNSNTNDLHHPRYHNVIMADGEMAVDRIGYPVVGRPMKSILDSTSLKLFFTSPFIDGGEISVDYAYTGNFHYSSEDIVNLAVGDVSVSRAIYYIKDMNTNPDNEYWVITDEVRADRAHQYEWLLHGIGTISGTGNVARTFTTRNGIGEEVALTAFFATPQVELVNVEQGTYGKHIQARVNGEDLDFLTVLYPRKTSGMANPDMSRIDQHDQKGYLLILDQGDQVIEDLCYLQRHKDKIETVRGTLSDGDLTFLRKIKGTTYSLILKKGSYISQNDNPLLRSTETLDVVALRYRNLNGGTLDGRLVCSSEAEVSFYDTQGRKVETRYFFPGSYLIDIPFGGQFDENAPKPPENLSIVGGS